RGEASPRTWLLEIARNRCVEHLERTAPAPDPDTYAGDDMERATGRMSVPRFDLDTVEEAGLDTISEPALDTEANAAIPAFDDNTIDEADSEQDTAMTMRIERDSATTMRVPTPS